MLKLKKLSKVFNELRTEEKLTENFQDVFTLEIDLISEIYLHFIGGIEF